MASDDINIDILELEIEQCYFFVAAIQYQLLAHGFRKAEHSDEANDRELFDLVDFPKSKEVFALGCGTHYTACPLCAYSTNYKLKSCGDCPAQDRYDWERYKYDSVTSVGYCSLVQELEADFISNYSDGVVFRETLEAKERELLVLWNTFHQMLDEYQKETEGTI